MKKIISIFLLCLLVCMPAFAIELVRQKNVATYIAVPLIDSSDDVSYKSSASGLDSEIDAFADGTAPDGFADCTNEATEVGSTGIYYLSLTQSEMNNDYIIVQIKSTDTNTQTVLIRTMVGDVANIATTDDGGTINVTSGKIDEVNKLTEFDEDNTTIDIDGTTLGTVTTATSVTNGVTVSTNNDKTGYSLSQSFPTNFADLAITATTGKVTVGTNDDKTGYSISGTTTTLDALSTHGDSAWATATGFSTHSAADVYTAFTEGSNEDVFKATGFSTHSATDVWETNISAYAGAGYAGTYLKGLNDNYTSTRAGYIDNLNGHTAQTGDSYAIVNNGTYGNSALETLVDDLETRLTAARAGYLDKLNVSGTLAHSDAAATYKATGFSTHSATDVWSVETRVLTGNTNLNDITAQAVWEYATRTLTSGGYSGLTASDVDAIWNEAQSGHTSAGTFGKYLDEAISGIDDNPWDAETRTLTAIDEDDTTLDLDSTTVNATASISDADIDKIWDEALSGHTSAGTTGKILSLINDATDGDKESDVYTGIENLIRRSR